MGEPEFCRASGKLRYPDSTTAQDALERIKAEKKPGHHERRRCYCTACAGWHLTSAAFRPVQTRRRRTP